MIVSARLVALLALVIVGSLSGVTAAVAQGGLQKFVADVAINSAFNNVLRRQPGEDELRRYRVRVFEDHWSEQDIEQDLRERSDYWPHSQRTTRQSSYEAEAMIRHAYEDILGRQPDPEGMRTYRSNVIDRGWTEFQVRDALRDSPEHRANPAAAADRSIDHAYRNVLGRDPDPNGRYSFRNQVQHHGWDEYDVEDALRDSPEYRAKNTISDAGARAIVRRAYLSVLGREPDPASAGFVEQVLKNHWTEDDVARELRNSPEFRNRPR